MWVKEYPTIEEISALFDYDDAAEKVVNGKRMRGALVRKSNGRPVFGSLTDDPRSRAMVGFPGRRVFYLHRVIWILHNGPVPTGLLIDHEDGDRGHNRNGNLRPLTSSHNQMNRLRSRSDSTVPYIGVCRARSGFNAFLSDNGKPVFVGNFNTAEGAAIARDEAVFKKYGAVARLNRDLFDLGARV